tara:strand:- start:790 stop:1203 length:414 start_codon:yes stop_codon:yes gene_type:complete
MSGDCKAKFDAAAFSDWAARLDRKSDGQISMTYEVTLPFTDAKKIENTLAELPGTEHQLTFGPDGETKATISRAAVPVSVSASVSLDGTEGTTSTTYLIVEELCGATGRTGATLTKISLDATGYRLDDGKIHAQAIP